MKDNKKQKNLLCGFIDVKIPPKGRKLGPWKAWKRQWCTLQESMSDNCVELVLGNSKRNVNNTITVPHFATLCRTESRTRPYAFGIFLKEMKNYQAVVFLSGVSETESQKWMARIRTFIRPDILPVSGEEFFVSLIDNSFSRSLGLFGVYGILSLNDTEMSIRDPTNGEVSASWKWSQIERNYVNESTQSTDDSGKIFVFQVSKHEYKGGGRGKIHLFCPKAHELQSAVLQYRLGRQRRIVTSPLPPTPHLPGYFAFHSTRRLSRSEGDLRWPFESSVALLNLRSRSSSRERNSNSLGNGDAKEAGSLGKIARSLILASASFSLLLSTPGCSEPDSLHEYQAITNQTDDSVSNQGEILQSNSVQSNSNTKFRSQTDIDEDSEIDDVGDLFSHPYFRTISAPGGTIGSRRVSGASVASGIYAEIDENQDSPNEIGQYQNLSDFMTDYTFCDESLKPPPLPPRRTNEYCSPGRTKDEINQLDEGKSLSQHELDLQNEYILQNVNETEGRVKEKTTKRPLPPPPSQISEVIESDKEYIPSNLYELNSTKKPEFKNYGIDKKQVKQTPEPDYLPMSQGPTKVSMGNDTYVVMANIINRKMSVTVAESVP